MNFAVDSTTKEIRWAEIETKYLSSSTIFGKKIKSSPLYLFKKGGNYLCSLALYTAPYENWETLYFAEILIKYENCLKSVLHLRFDINCFEYIHIPIDNSIRFATGVEKIVQRFEQGKIISQTFTRLAIVPFRK